MGKKRKHSDRHKSDRDILKQLRKLERKLKKRRKSSSSESSTESQDHDQYVNDSDVEYIPTDCNESAEENIEPSVQSNIQQTDLHIDPAPSSSTMQIQKPENEKITEIPVIDEVVLALLGDEPKIETVGKDIHADIAKRLQDILQNGLKKETKENIKEEYPIPGNCEFFKAPILNPEIKAAVSDILQKKDASLASRQDQIGLALTALSQAMDILVVDKSEICQVTLKHVSNACRLLCDSHYIDTKIRRNFLISTLNNKLKDTLKESKRDKSLFGETLPEKLRATKAITKTSQDLRILKPKPNTNKNNTAVTNTNNLNWRRPQPNNQNRKTATTVHRTAGVTNRNQSQRNETSRRQLHLSSHARTSAPYKHHKRT